VGDLSKNFSRWEFACGCGCGYATVDAELLQILQPMRDALGACTVTSGCRCPEHNRAEGGAIDSWHLQGRAADVQFASMAPADWYALAEKLGARGIGLYPSWVHIDTRPGPVARWTG